MQVIVVCNDVLKEELLSQGPADADITWLGDAAALDDCARADAVIDLLFENNESHLQRLRRFLPSTVVIGSVSDTLSETDGRFLRINNWTTMLRGGIVEGAAEAAKRPEGEALFSCFGKTVHWLPDVAGFLTPRVVSAIINEACLSLEEGVSTEADINTAMKLGTNYPYGPFEWAKLIGRGRIHNLLQKLSVNNPRYLPAKSLQA